MFSMCKRTLTLMCSKIAPPNRYIGQGPALCTAAPVLLEMAWPGVCCVAELSVPLFSSLGGSRDWGPDTGPGYTCGLFCLGKGSQDLNCNGDSNRNITENY